MIELARPAYLWAGAVLASVPVLLHLLRARERVRKPLPTARFLTPDPRRRVRIHRRPDQILLLLLRMSIAAAIGAAFAGPRWIGPANGTATVVVVDAGAATRPVWEAVRDLAGPDGPADRLELALVRPGDAGAPTLVRLDSELPGRESWTELAPDEQAGEVRLGHLLRALRDVAGRSTGVDSLSARIVTVPGWAAWGPGVRELRDSLWPGRIELVVPAVPRSPGTEPRAQTVVVQADAPLRALVATALAVLGVAADTLATGAGAEADGDDEADADRVVRLRVGREESLGPLWQAAPPTGPEADSQDGSAPGPDREAEAGSEREAGPEADERRPPDSTAAAASGRSAVADAFLLLDGRVLPGAGSPPRGIPSPGSTVPLLRTGGRPAAAARVGALDCDIALPLTPGAPILGSGDLAVLLDAVLREACGVAEAAGAEEAWRALLERDGTGAGDRSRAGSDPNGRVAAADVRGARAGLSLTRLLLALALAMGVAEIWTTRRMHDRRSRSAVEDRR